MSRVGEGCPGRRTGTMRVAFMIVTVVWGVYGLYEMLKK